MSDSDTYSLLVTDLSTRKAFDLANIMRSHNIDLIFCDALNVADDFMLRSAYKGQIELLRKDENFNKDLSLILEKYSDKKIVYIPIEEDTTILVYDFLAQNRYKNFYHNLPPEKSFQTVRDKGVFATFCEQNDIPVPKIYDFDTLLQMDVLPSPLILKPRSGSGSIGIRFIDTKEELEACKALPMEKYLIQERLENPKDIEGGFFLFDKGQPVSYYGHKRIRTYPSTGGVSVYSKCELNPELQVLGEEVLKKLQWSGLAMVEFLYDTKSNSYKIIEINPRLWGSLMLSEFCGSRMLENYCRSALNQTLYPVDIQENRYLRWLFPWDILAYIQTKGGIKHFWMLDRAHTCYVNFSYGSFRRSVFFTFYNIVNPRKLRKLYQKVIGL